MEKDWTEVVSSPTEEIGLWGKSKLCIDMKYNTTLPDDLLKNASSPWVPVETGLQSKSKLCIDIKYNTTLPRECFIN